MTKLRSLPYAVLTFSLLAAGGVSAQSMGSIDAREAEQQQRIASGVRDGSLTRGETYRLEQGERRIEQYEARARADGHVSGYERQRLDNMLDRESREIHQQRTDGQRAGWNGGGWNGHEGHGGGWDRGRDGWDRGGWDRNGSQHGWNSADGHGGWQNGGHQPGGWNQGGWNQGNANHGGGNAGGWNQGGWNGHAPGTPSTPSTPTSGQPGGWSHNGGQAGGTPGGWSGHAPGATPTSPAAGTPAAGGNAGWHGGTHAQPQYQARPMAVAATTQVQPRAAFNGGGGGRRH